MQNTFRPIHNTETNVGRMFVCNRLSFSGFSGAPSHCAVVLIETTSGRHISVCSQPSGKYFGTSVTNALEIICEEVRKAGFKDWTKWGDDDYWFEHYPVGAGILLDRYTLMRVTFEGSAPSWDSNGTWRNAAKLVGVSAEALAYGYESELEI